MSYKKVELDNDQVLSTTPPEREIFGLLTPLPTTEQRLSDNKASASRIAWHGRARPPFGAGSRFLSQRSGSGQEQLLYIRLAASRLIDIIQLGYGSSSTRSNSAVSGMHIVGHLC
jgi:hypothetical protein